MHGRTLSLWALACLLLLAWPGAAQQLDESQWADGVLMPAGTSIAPPGKDWRADGWAGRGLSLHAVPKAAGEGLYRLPSQDRIAVTTDALTITLRAGEAVRLISQPVAVSAAPVSFFVERQLSGAPPAQVSIALIDAQDPRHLSVAMHRPAAMNEAPGLLSASFEPTGAAVALWLQLLGPPAQASNGPVESTVTLRRMRMLQGDRKADDRMGAERLGAPVDLDAQTPPFRLVPPSTAGSQVVVETKASGPASDAVLRVHTVDRRDVARVAFEVPALPLSGRLHERHASLDLNVRVRKAAGNQGILSLGVFDPASGSGGVTEYAVEQLPRGDWVSLTCPMQFAGAPPANPMVFLQVRQGAAQLEIDGVALKTNRDSMHGWRHEQLMSSSAPHQ